MTTINLAGSPYIPDLSAAEKYVYTYLLEHREARMMTIRQLAAATHVSTATVIRLARKFGFSGFADFHEDLVSRYRYEDILSDTDSRILLSSFFENTWHSVSFKKSLQEAALLIRKCHAVLFIPDSGTHAACEYGAASFSDCGKKTAVYGKQKNIRSGTCAIAVSASENCGELRETLQQLRALSVPSVSILCSSGIYTGADITITCFEGNVAGTNTLIPCVAVLEDLRKRIL